MRLFSSLLERVMQWAKHRHACYYLAGLSFVEASVFPIPPDVILISMTLATPHKAWRYALLTVLFSVVGGMFGYLLGEYFFSYIHPYILQFGYAAAYGKVQHWFDTWGFWIIIFAGFIPIPYKLFTIGAGATHMIFWPFVMASVFSRSVRFFVVTAAVYYGGMRFYTWVHRYSEYVGFTILGLIGLFCLVKVLS